ncbi:MAG: hypothetical protein ACM3OB_04650 [Acidobacteriota bacterium]
MAWYRLSFTIRNDDLDANLSSYRDKIQGALGKFAGREASARVYSLRDGETSEIYVEIAGKQPPTFLMRLILCEPCPLPPTLESLRLLGELRDGELRHAEPPTAPAAAPAAAPDSFEPA